MLNPVRVNAPKHLCYVHLAHSYVHCWGTRSVIDTSLSHPALCCSFVLSAQKGVHAHIGGGGTQALVVVRIAGTLSPKPTSVYPRCGSKLSLASFGPGGVAARVLRHPPPPPKGASGQQLVAKGATL